MSTKKNRQCNISDLQQKYGALTISKFISAWRLSEGVSQKEFAHKLGISPANLCDIEKGRKGISIFRAIEIAKCIGYSPTVLVQIAIQEQLEASGLDYVVELKKKVA